MGDVTVRPVAPQKIEEFLDWFARYWEELETFSDYPDPFARAEYRRLLQRPEGRQFWWAAVDGRRCGFCVFTIGPHWYRQDVTDGYVDEFYIAPEARRGGIGRAVAESMLAECRRQGARQVELSVLPRNARAVAFWTSLGFGLETLRMAVRLAGDAAARGTASAP